MKKLIASLVGILLLLGLVVLMGNVIVQQQNQLDICRSFTVTSERLVTLASEALDLSGQLIDATEDSEYERINAEFDKLNPQIKATAQTYKIDRANCRGEKLE